MIHGSQSLSLCLQKGIHIELKMCYLPRLQTTHVSEENKNPQHHHRPKQISVSYRDVRPEKLPPFSWRTLQKTTPVKKVILVSSCTSRRTPNTNFFFFIGYRALRSQSFFSRFAQNRFLQRITLSITQTSLGEQLTSPWNRGYNFDTLRVSYLRIFQTLWNFPVSLNISFKNNLTNLFNR